ncbi:hypothetical protein F5883DRAFT_646575 [Diaporthe sp. PMI_573]|nr:hypothetical protein F5883DRAFT_646575 [Diaporthaceae sp. PMI_573]
MGSLPTPEGLTRPRPPPHVYGITPEPRETGRASHLPVRRLTGLKRRNAQRRSSKSPAQQDFESFHDEFYARFRRGGAARDVNVVYLSPIDLARRKSVLPRIQEAAHKSSGSGTRHQSALDDHFIPQVSFDGEPLLEKYEHQEETDDSPWLLGSTTERRVSLPAQKTQHQSCGNEQNKTGARTATSLRRLSFVIRGPRSAPATASVSSSTPLTPPSATPTAATHAPTSASEPAPEPELESESKHHIQDETWCGTAGCQWTDCSRIRGNFKMPVPGAVGENKPEHDGKSAAGGRNEDDIVSVGEGFSFLKLN